MALTFPKSARLTLDSEFRRVKTEGRSHGGRYLALGVLKNAGDASAAAGGTRAGLIASRRVGNAAVRNRIRRRLRELVRTTRPGWIPAVWVVVIARRAAADATFAQLRQEWLRLARRAGVLAAAKKPEKGSP